MIKLDTNALSPPDSTYCLLRVPTTYPGLLDFAGRSKKYLKHRAMGLLYHSRLPLRLPTLCLSTTTKLSSGLDNGGGYTFHTHSNAFLQRTLY